MRCFPKKNLSCDNQFQLDFGKNAQSPEPASYLFSYFRHCLFIRFVIYQPRCYINSFGGQIFLGLFFDLKTALVLKY